ncbi:MAG TPA: dihydrodipicolinate synthase family protein [Candidatus Binatia bacterium]|jgi:4-hydroxy-tetrahydrodipicolinate synthase
MAGLNELRKTVKGLVIPIPAVFDGKGEPDLPMIEKLADWYLDAGVHAFFILGSQGQGPACRIDQRKAVAETVVRRVNGRVPCIVQVGAVEPYTSIELGLHAKQIGADAIGVVGPYYYSDRNEWELIEHYKMVDKAVGLPMLLYNNPEYSGYPIPPAMMAKLREAVPNVFAAKLAMGSIDQAVNYLRVLSREFIIFIPITQMIPGMLVGVSGSIAAGTPVTVPEIGVQLIEAIWAQDFERAQKLEVLLLEHGERMAPIRGYGRRVTLEGLRIRGLAVKEYPRWPTKPLSAEHQKLYEENMKRVLDELSALTPAAAGQKRKAAV